MDTEREPWESPYLRVAAEAASSGVEVILTGEGGNDWLEPERAEAADYLRSLRLLALSRLWDAQRKRRRSALAASRAVLWRNGLRPLIRDTAFAALGHLGTVPREPVGGGPDDRLFVLVDSRCEIFVRL